MFVESRSCSIHFEVHGAGPCLLLIHGNPMWGDLWRERGYLDLLTGKFTVVTIDVLGYGESDKPTEPAMYGFPNMARDALAVLDAIDADRTHVWGYSMGAWIAEALTVLHPERVDSLTFGGNVPGLTADVKALLGKSATEAAEAGNWDAILIPGLPEQTRADYVRINDLDAIAAAASQYESWACSTLDLRATGVPTLVYVGSEEWFHDFAASQATEVGATFKRVPGDHRLAFAQADKVVPEVLGHLLAATPQR
ncbi:MAG TPA: alpha/beta hydrolase [Acidimicrobiales bacterium]